MDTTTPSWATPGSISTARMAWRRIAAWLIDWACVLVWVGITAAVGVPLYLAGVLRPVGIITLNVIAALVLVVPVVLAFSVFEARPTGSTLGKRALRVRVRVDGGAVGFRRALIRNTLKIGLPWLFGHAAVFGFASTSTDHGSTSPGVIVLTVAAYVLPIVYLIGLFTRSGRTIYDVIAHTTVDPVKDTRRPRRA